MGNNWSGSHSPLIDEEIKKHCIVIYSTTVCGFCSKTKTLLDGMNFSYHVVELDQLSQQEGGKTSQELLDKTRMLTVPQIFINGEFIGGYTEIMALKQVGNLMEKVSKCRISCAKEETS